MVDKIVVWHEQSLDPDNRSHYAIATLLNEAFDSVGGFSHLKVLPADVKKAIVVIHGEHERHQAEQIAQELNQLDQALVIVIGDEGALFPTRRLQHPSHKMWVQMPVPGRHDHANHYLICSYPHDAPSLIPPISDDRPLDWFFSGQVQHARRSQCVAQLSRLPKGFLNTTPGFWQGFEHSEYYKLMASAKIVPCPAGSCTPDTIRVGEAIEAGCVPIVDGLFPQPNYPSNYWSYALQGEPPFPVIYNWSDLPRIMDEELSKWPHNRNRIQAWWKEYKNRMAQWLREDTAW